jgi:hypothetical protein
MPRSHDDSDHRRARDQVQAERTNSPQFGCPYTCCHPCSICPSSGSGSTNTPRNATLTAAAAATAHVHAVRHRPGSLALRRYPNPVAVAHAHRQASTTAIKAARISVPSSESLKSAGIGPSARGLNTRAGCVDHDWNTRPASPAPVSAQHDARTRQARQVRTEPAGLQSGLAGASRAATGRLSHGVSESPRTCADRPAMCRPRGLTLASALNAERAVFARTC